jgi:hypothetical protein
MISGSMTSGATVNCSISPVAGVNTETTILHAIDHTFVIKFKLNSSDPGLLQHFEKGFLLQEMTSTEFSSAHDDSILSGFENEDVSFFDAVRDGIQPVNTFASCRQSVEIMQAMRERRAEYHL